MRDGEARLRRRWGKEESGVKQSASSSLSFIKSSTRSTITLTRPELTIASPLIIAKFGTERRPKNDGLLLLDTDPPLALFNVRFLSADCPSNAKNATKSIGLATMTTFVGGYNAHAVLHPDFDDEIGSLTSYFVQDDGRIDTVVAVRS